MGSNLGGGILEEFLFWASKLANRELLSLWMTDYKTVTFLLPFCEGLYDIFYTLVLLFLREVGDL